MIATLKLDDQDRQDLNYIVEVINSAAEALAMVKGMESLTEDQARDYYQGCCDCLLEGRLSLHLIRQKISKKYNVPYVFDCTDGVLSYEVE